MKYIIEALLMLCTICACSQQQVQREIINEVESAQLFARDSIIGYSNDPRMDEISGLVTSGTNPGLFWVHNDGGDEPLVYLINRQMEVQMVVKLTNAVQYREAHAEIDKVSNIDWEDITRMEEQGKSYLVVGDIGDNRAKRSELFLYRIEEPVFTGDSLINVNAEKMTIHYEEGARDAETLMTDPFTGNMILLSKRERKVKYYDFPFVASEKVISSSGELNLTYLTGGDINSNGDILVKHYDHVYLLRNGGEASVSEMLLQAAWEEVNYKVEVQGEAICWGNDNRSYYTTAERRYDKPEPFYWYY